MDAEIAAELRRVKARIAAFDLMPVERVEEPAVHLRRISDREVRNARSNHGSRFEPKRPKVHHKLYSKE